MKKKLLLTLLVVMTLVCLFTIAVSAETALKPQTTNAYGELSFFDESITVGRTNTSNGFTPFMSDGTTYARIVMGDGTTFYTFPTAYALSNTALYGDSTKCIMVLDFTSLNSAMQTVTETNPNWGKANIYRIELPAHMQYLNADNQCFSSCTNLIEIYLQPNTTTKDTGKTMLFWKCSNLETIHNLDTFVFKKGCLGGSFQECKKLTNLTIGVSPDATTTDSNMFRGCTSLVSVNFAEAFPNLTTIGDNIFNGCTALTSITIPAGFTTIKNDAFQSCTSLATVTFAGNAGENAVIGQAAFEKCTALTELAIPEGVITLGNCVAKNAGIKKLTLPSTLTTMSDSQNFWNCPLEYIIGLENTKITKLPQYCFRGCSDYKGETLILPNTLTTIGNQCLADMGKNTGALKTVVLGANVTTIDAAAFTNFSATAIYMPAGVTSFSSSAKLYDAPSIRLVYLVGDNTTALNTAWTDSQIVSYADYTNAPSDYASGKYIVYGVNACVAFYNGVHDTEGVVGVNQFKGDDYVTDYICASGCNRNCGMQAETFLCGPLFTNKGYSKIADGTMFTYGVVINEENIAKYVELSGEAFNYGVIIGAANFDSEGNLIETNAIIDNTGKALIANSIVVDFSKVELENFTIYNVKMQGIETEAQRNLPIYCCAYIIDGESVSYMGNEVTENAKTVSSSTITVIETTTTTPPATGDDQNA